MSEDDGATPDWLSPAHDDLRPEIARHLAARTPFALATLVAAVGGPRPVGAQMLVGDGLFGFLSGGCVEADVARHARAALATGEPLTLAYGQGSPIFDIRLPCGGRIDLLVEPVAPDDPAMRALVAAGAARRPVRYRSDGRAREVVATDRPAEKRWAADVAFAPAQRLLVVGGDPFALAMAAAGLAQGWEVTLVRPNGPAAPPPLPVAYRRDAPEAALAALAPDPWTAVAVATHDAGLDRAALGAALASGAGYVGVLGSRRRLGERRAALLADGFSEAEMARLRAPIGLPILAATPREIAVAVVAEVIERRPALPVPHALGAAVAS